MKKTKLRKVVSGIIAGAMATAMIATMILPVLPVSAAEIATEEIPAVDNDLPEGLSAAAAATAKKKTVSMVVSKQVKMKNEDIFLGSTPAKSGTAKITNSNSKVGKVTTYKQKGSSLVWYYFQPKTVGKTTVTIKAGKTTLKRSISVVRYLNPVSYIKIGKSKVSKAFKKSDTVTLSYDKYKKGGKLIVAPNAGFQLAYSAMYNKAGAEVDYINAYGNIKPSDRGRGGYLLMRFQNRVTGVEYTTKVLFK